MPRYDPTILPTESLNLDILNFTADIERLDNETTELFEAWRIACVQGQSDAVVDNYDRSCKNLRRKRTMALNKKYKATSEKLRRDIEDSRYILRRFAKPIRPIDGPHNILVTPEAQPEAE